jgi:hypothetical protein
MHLGQHKSSTSQKTSDSQSGTVIYVIALLVIIAITIVLVLYSIKSHALIATTSSVKYPEAVYTHCSDKPLNRPTRQAFSTLGINFVSPGELDVLAQQPSNHPLKIIYIPCSYNNSDWDIQQFLQNYLALANKHQTKKPNILTAAVLGCNKLCAKNGLWSVLELTYGRQKARSITPESWVIPAQSVAFHKQMRKTQDTGQAFILKKNIQGKQGLLLTNSRDILGRLASGSDGVSVEKSSGDKYAVVQKYISQPYLVSGRKLNIRLYILVVISQETPNPEWWLYTAGKCIYTNREYQPLPADTTIKSGSPDDMPLLEQHFTSLNLDSNQVYSIDRCPETLGELNAHMSGHGEDWPGIWKKIQLGLQKVAIAYKDKLSVPPGVVSAYQLFGADYIIDAIDAINNDAPGGVRGTPYLLEFNKGPEMKYKSPKDPELKSGLQQAVLELVLGHKPDPTKWILLNSVTKSKQAKTTKYKSE